LSVVVTVLMAVGRRRLLLKSLMTIACDCQLPRHCCCVQL